MTLPAVIDIPVSTELIAEMGEWSRPVQVKITYDGTAYEMQVRLAEFDGPRRLPVARDGEATQ